VGRGLDLPKRLRIREPLQSIKTHSKRLDKDHATTTSVLDDGDLCQWSKRSVPREKARDAGPVTKRCNHSNDKIKENFIFIHI